MTLRSRSKLSAPNLAGCSDLPECCPPKPALIKRPLLSLASAGELSGVFKILANGSRLRLLHALARACEMPVGVLAEATNMTPQAVSNQLQRLALGGIVGARREGNKIYYRMIDPCVLELLDKGLCLAEDARERRRRK